MEIVYYFLDHIHYLLTDDNYYYSVLSFFLFLFIYHTIGLPGHVPIMLIGGFFFGTYISFILNMTSIVLGSLIFFLFGKHFLSKYFPNFLSKYSQKIDTYLSNNTIEYLIIFRLFPGTPLFLQNLILSFLNVSKIKFILSTFIGLGPSVFVISFVGGQINNLTEMRSMNVSNLFSIEFYISIFLVILLLLLNIIYHKKK